MGLLGSLSRWWRPTAPIDGKRLHDAADTLEGLARIIDGDVHLRLGKGNAWVDCIVGGRPYTNVPEYADILAQSLRAVADTLKTAADKPDEGIGYVLRLHFEGKLK